MRTIGTLTFVVGLEIVAGSVVMAQQITVQQPQQQIFAVDTMVSVPDRGDVLLGGASSASMSRNSVRGLTGSRGIGSSVSGSSARAHVFIHDFEALDAELLSRPVSPRTDGAPPPAPSVFAPGLDEEARTQQALRGLKRYRKLSAIDRSLADAPLRPRRVRLIAP